MEADALREAMARLRDLLGSTALWSGLLAFALAPSFAGPFGAIPAWLVAGVAFLGLSRASATRRGAAAGVVALAGLVASALLGQPEEFALVLGMAAVPLAVSAYFLAGGLGEAWVSSRAGFLLFLLGAAMLAVDFAAQGPNGYPAANGRATGSAPIPGDLPLLAALLGLALLLYAMVNETIVAHRSRAA